MFKVQSSKSNRRSCAQERGCFAEFKVGIAARRCAIVALADREVAALRAVGMFGNRCLAGATAGPRLARSRNLSPCVTVRKRGRVSGDLSLAVLFSGGLGRVLSVPRAWLGDLESRPESDRAGLHLCGSRSLAADSSLAARRLALVSRDVAAGDRSVSTGPTGSCGPLYLSAANRNLLALAPGWPRMHFRVGTGVGWF